jgi:hypothetical protein
MPLYSIRFEYSEGDNSNENRDSLNNAIRNRYECSWHYLYTSWIILTDDTVEEINQFIISLGNIFNEDDSEYLTQQPNALVILEIDGLINARGFGFLENPPKCLLEYLNVLPGE